MYVVIPTESSFLQIIKLRQNYADPVNDRKLRLVPQPRVTHAHDPRPRRTQVY